MAPPAALPPAPLILPPSGPLAPGPYRLAPRRSLADMANEQLRRGKPKDALEQGVEGAGRDDCLHQPEQRPKADGLLNAPSVIGRAMSGECAR